MTLIRHTGRNPDPKWKYMDKRKIDSWRKKAMANVHNSEGRRVELEVGAVAVHQGWDKADVDAAGNPIIEAPVKEDPRSGRETAAIMAKNMSEMMMRLRANDPAAFREKVREMQAQGALSHLTLEQACQEIDQLVRKVAELEVPQVYEAMGLMDKA